MTWLSFGERSYHAGSLRVDLRPVADVQADVLALPFRSGSFAGVEFYHVLEHLLPWDGEAALAELRRVTAAGGAVEVSTPDLLKCARTLLLGHLAVLDNIFSPRREAAQCHRCGYTPATLAAALRLHLRDVADLPGGFDEHEVRMVGYV